MIYSNDISHITAVLDWELSTLGDPITDLVSCLVCYYMPQGHPSIACKCEHSQICNWSSCAQYSICMNKL